MPMVEGGSIRDNVHRGLAQHAVVLEFRLAEGRRVAGNEHQLGLAVSQRLQGGLVSARVERQQTYSL